MIRVDHLHIGLYTVTICTSSLALVNKIKPHYVVHVSIQHERLCSNRYSYWYSSEGTTLARTLNLLYYTGKLWIHHPVYSSSFWVATFSRLAACSFFTEIFQPFLCICCWNPSWMLRIHVLYMSFNPRFEPTTQGSQNILCPWRTELHVYSLSMWPI